jgi:hypothetical protein
MKRSQFALAPLFLTVGVAAMGAGGCEDEFSDEKFGVLDLASYYDGGTQNNPTAGVPDQVEANPGYLNGQVAEYYDFGFVPSIIDLNTGAPTAVRVQPMYFFFDEADRPLFSQPVRELRSGIDWMRGGHDVLNPNPKDYCEGVTGDQTQCKKDNDNEKKKSYPLRRRDPLIDPNRNVDDYQRPLVDLSPRDRGGPASEYTGLWEMLEVTVPPKYVVDSIKHVATLQKALASGKFKVRSTGKVINCPMVDERTYVNRGMTARRIFHPRIELWYRRLLTTCFLANGWETLGREDGVRYFANSDQERLDTFDVVRVDLGNGPTASQRVMVPVGRAYEPAIIVDDQSFENAPTITRVAFNVITSLAPRHFPSDPPGYTPMRWMFDALAPNDYEAGHWKSESEIDLSSARGRRQSAIVPLVRNLATRGVAPKCSYERLPQSGQCGKTEAQNRNGVVVADPLGDPICNAERDPFNPKDPPLECNPDTCFCDAPFVSYGQACGPGLAQCQQEGDKFSEEGYECFPPWGGFCQRACSGTNDRAAENQNKEPTEWVDSRCGGTPGFICLASLSTCIKVCDQNVTAADQCKVDMKVGEETRDIQEGQTCQDFGLQVCAWPDTWDPKDFPIPQ